MFLYLKQSVVKPLLVIQGREDHYATPEQLVVIQRQVPGPCSYVLLDNCRTFPRPKQPNGPCS
nr:hypothetical protein [uncultured Pseudomonas sp.]